MTASLVLHPMLPNPMSAAQNSSARSLVGGNAKFTSNSSKDGVVHIFYTRVSLYEICWWPKLTPCTIAVCNSTQQQQVPQTRPPQPQRPRPKLITQWRWTCKCALYPLIGEFHIANWELRALSVHLRTPSIRSSPIHYSYLSIFIHSSIHPSIHPSIYLRIDLHI